MGATIRVPVDQPTIQDGINASVSGDWVLVAPGTYVENIDFAGKAITLQGESGPDATIIDANQAGSGVIFANGETATSVIDGFAIRNGIGTISGFFPYGGGIYCYGSSPTIQNCTITENTLFWGRGGGIYFDQSSPTITNCTISNNDGGLEGGGISFDNSSPTIRNCTIIGNIAIYGGGIDCNTSTPTLADCAITGNTALANGGGLTCAETSSPIQNCTITGNKASCGAGVHYYSCPSAELVNCTVAANRADSQGGGVFCEWNSSVAVKNCILWGNSALDGPEIGIGWVDHPSTLSVSTSDVQGGELVAYMESGCTLNWLAGNIESDPLVVDPGHWDDNGTPDVTSDDLWVDGDYHLTDTSPCIDAGADTGLESDKEGDVRPQGGGFDIGADEFNSPVVVACGECEGKVTELTLLYAGAAATFIEVEQKKEGIIFDGMVDPGDTFTLVGMDKKGTLGPKIKIFVDGDLNIKIHTSCSEPIGPGLVIGDFEVIEGYSRKGGELCPL